MPPKNKKLPESIDSLVPVRDVAQQVLGVLKGAGPDLVKMLDEEEARRAAASRTNSQQLSDVIGEDIAAAATGFHSLPPKDRGPLREQIWKLGAEQLEAEKPKSVDPKA